MQLFYLILPPLAICFAAFPFFLFFAQGGTRAVPLPEALIRKASRGPAALFRSVPPVLRNSLQALILLCPRAFPSGMTAVKKGLAVSVCFPASRGMFFP